MKQSKLKVILGHSGIHELLALHRADALAANRGTEHVTFCERLLRKWTQADLNPAQLLTGDDLIKLGLEPGPVFKEILDRIREAQLDGLITTREDAMRLVEQIQREQAGKQ
jgi:poly(A) polymerase